MFKRIKYFWKLWRKSKKYWADEEVKPMVIGALGGPGRTCPLCVKEKELIIYSNGMIACKDCKV